ncbi:MAG: Nif3-like dinuclear metal center hexameric protein [Clostridia bacterium]|nr:Nif3-like dinuclear metal center hexameric protein [Clostridia bacterium]
MRIQDILTFLDTRAPFATAEEWDNPGLLVGSPSQPVNGILVALDATPGAIESALAIGANLIVTHHPVIFAPLRRLDGDSLPYRLAAAGIGLIAAHTNLDIAAGGVNDTLAACLGLEDVTVAPDGMSRIGRLPTPEESTAFARQVAEALDTPVRVCGNREIRTVAVCGGGGGEFASALTGQVDAFVTGEVKHHQWLEANAAGLTLIEAGHYATEVPVVDTLCTWLQEAFPTLPVTPYRDGQPYITVK